MKIIKQLLLAGIVSAFLCGQTFGAPVHETVIKKGKIDNAPIGETTPSTIRGKFVTINKSACNVTLTTVECSDTLITNYGWNGTADQNFKFPTAEGGLKTKFRNLVTVAKDIYFDPFDDTTQSVLDGTACGDGERIWTDDATKYESIICETFSEDGGLTWDWACDSINGIWLDKGS